MSEKRFGYDGGVWGRKFAEGWGEGKAPEARLLKFIEDNKQEIGPKVLDVGMGVGRHAIPLAKMGYKVTGLEYSQEGTEITREKEKREGVEIDMVRGDFRELPFKPDEFDTIICISTLHHNNWKGLEMAFSEIAKTLKPGGLFFLKIRSDKTPLKKGENIIPDKGMTTKMMNEHGKVEFHHNLSREEIDELAAMNNLDIVEEPVDERLDKNGHPQLGHWNITFRKRDL